jgi:hypothetical protein
MAKPASASLSFWMVLLLVICLGGLTLHFFTESLGPDSLFPTSSEVAGHYDENYIQVNFTLSEVSSLLVKINLEQAPSGQSFGQPPLLPPPNI